MGHKKKDCRVKLPGGNRGTIATGYINKGANGAGPSGSKDPPPQQGKLLALDNVLYVPGIRKNLISGIVLNSHGFKQVIESDKYVLSKHGTFVGFGYLSSGMFKLNIHVPFDSESVCMASSSSNKVDTISNLWHARLGHVNYARMQDMAKMSLIPGFDMRINKCHTCKLTKITRKPFKDIKRDSRVLDLIHSDLCDLHSTPSLGNKKYVITFIDDASRFCYVYLLHAKDEALDKFKVYKQEVELHKSGLIKHLRTDRGGEYYNPVYFQSTGIIHQTTAPYTPQQNGVAERKNKTLKEMVNSMLSYSGLSEEPKKSTRVRKAKSFGSDFHLYLVEGTRNKVQYQYQYCYNIEEDPKTFSEAMNSRDANFWKEVMQDEIDSIMHNKTWKFTDLPPGCKPLGSKWIFKKKMKVDGSIDKCKARLVIQGFRQKEGIDFFDTYAPVARISTIRLLLALAAIHNLIIHKMDVKTAFLNGELEEEIYMKQPEGFVMPGNEHKVCKLIKSLYGLKQAPKKWHQKFDEVVLSTGFVLNQADKRVYSKFDYFGEAEVILGIRIIRENNGINISQSHYIEKILKKFNCLNCSPVGTPIDPTVKLLPNQGNPISQLEYAKAIGCLIYAMVSTRPVIAFAVGKLSRYTSNPSSNHWQAVNRLFKYLKGTINYGLCYSGTPPVIEGFSNASWITNLEDHSSTSGWVFLLGGGAICLASKKQTCITSSTMEFEFVALASAGKEAEWLRNLLFEISLWPKPISPISIRCDSAATLAKAYSQVYNGNSRHLGVRHNMIRELIMNGIISVEFVRSQYNMADHQTKGLRRDLVKKSVIGMGLKSTL
ncbi:hypothetical protein E3N88_32870 [Mikania micrantha]|uniref:Integrase catalytic domain-containing protein n=1 Tax=Mikania micrantha TaxID=192012 RepID=A0A5N6M9S9_9ASTR|nr:hypothetical protein E3N88_32870 [Mikania micrantha]